MRTKIWQRLLILVATFYGGLHFTAIGLADKFINPTWNLLSLLFGILCLICPMAYCVMICIIKFKAIRRRQAEESESND